MRLNIKRHKLGQKGDTIIEVLISLALLSFVLAGAYYTSNQSYRNVRDSQEHSEATTLAETQVEELRQYVQENGPFNTATDQCLTDSGTAINPEPYTGPGSPPTCYVENTDQSNTGYQTKANCASSSAAYCYIITISGPTASPPVGGVGPYTSVTFYTYTVNVSWPPLGGGPSDDQVTLYYRADN